MRTFIDQYNNIFHVNSIKELKQRLNRTKASKMYIDTKKGTIHIGYVIGQHWLTEYQRVEKPVN